MVIDDDVVGYRPIPDVTVNVTYTSDGITRRPVYTISEQGRRIMPDCDDPHAPGVLFFGCSQTFGSGVNDDETYPRVRQSCKVERPFFKHAASGV